MRKWRTYCVWWVGEWDGGEL